MEGGIFSAEVPFSQLTSACVKLTKEQHCAYVHVSSKEQNEGC